MKRWLWVLIGFLVLGFLGPATYVVGNHLRHTSATVARKLGTPLPVRVVVAKQANLTQTIGASGEVQPMANLDLTAAMSARVDKVTVDLGDLVAPKQELLPFDRELLQAVLTASHSALDQAIGDQPRAAQKVFTIGRIDQVLVVSNIAEERIEDITIGQAASVTLMAFPNDEFAGTVVKVKPVTDPKTRTFLVYTKVANPGLKLKPGLTAFTRFKRQHEALAVPSVSLINPTGIQESTVFVLEHGSIARLRKVRVGVVAEGMTEIRSGLTAGEQVIVVGQIALRDGDQVIIGDEFHELKDQVAHRRQDR